MKEIFFNVRFSALLHLLEIGYLRAIFSNLSFTSFTIIKVKEVHFSKMFTCYLNIVGNVLNLDRHFLPEQHSKFGCEMFFLNLY